MKRILKASMAGVLICILMITSMLVAVAAPVSTVNGVEAPVGSTVEYTIDFVSYKQDVVGVQVFYKFDPKHLELKETAFDIFPSATVNPNLGGDGMIYMNYTNPSDPIDFSESKEIGKLQFEVIAEGESTIEYYIQYIYDFDLVNIYDYTITYSLTVDGEAKVADKNPPLADINEVLSIVEDANSFDTGDFANNEEGTGSGIKPTEAPKGTNSNNDKNDDKGDGNNAILIIGIVVGIMLVAVVIIAISKKKKAE